ncbi:MAG: PASTA domain-containing protein [Flavobacteriales bacterium]|nr:PASTA domain-containing protein [Flavobacteriales bacterium]
MSGKRLLRLALPLVLLVLLLGAGWMWLRSYTRHEVSVRVPDLRALSLEEATDILARRDLQLMVIDSVHTDDRPKGSVVDQDPAAGRDVKPGRKVYVVMNANQPKMIDMPRLVDLSKRQALSILDILGLKVKELQYKPDPCTDCVIAQLYKGEPIEPDTRIRKGESITLVLGSGEKGGRVPVPDLRGLTHAEVGMVLNMASLNLGVVVDCEGCNTPGDSALARVRRQSPVADASNRIAYGSMIDIWLTADTTGLRPTPGWDDPDRYRETEEEEDDEENQ